MTDEAQVIEQQIRFAARDGYDLAGLLMKPADVGALAGRGGVLISSGTGFPKEYYRRFARMGAKRGFTCLLYDYRGIAGSAPQDMAAFEMDYPDWGRLDMPAALDRLEQEVGQAPIVHVGHSVGGHFVGFWDNHARVARHIFLCVGSGNWSRHHLTSIPSELFFWWLYGPVCLARKGFIPAGGAWGGTALPRGVFQTWRRWCSKPDYFMDELVERLRPHDFDSVSAPITSFIYSDDPISTPRTGADMLRVYPNAPSELVVRAPSDYGVKAIGHAGLFRSAASRAWGEVWDAVEIGRAHV